MAYLPSMHPYLRTDARIMRPTGVGPHRIPGGVDPQGLGSIGAPTMPDAAMAYSNPYTLGLNPGSQSANVAKDMQKFSNAVARRFDTVGEKSRLSSSVTVRQTNDTGPTLVSTGNPGSLRVNSAMYKSQLMTSSMTQRMVPETNDLVAKLTAQRAMDSAQNRRVQIAADLEREALALERTAITEAKRALTSEEVQKAAADALPALTVKPTSTMNTALVLGALALGVIATAMWVKR
jgi:hypothetical protein